MFSSCCCCCCWVTKSCPTLCNPMDSSTPGFLVPHHLLKFAEVHVHCVGDAIETISSSASPFSSSWSFPRSRSFLASQLFTSLGQSTGASALASVLPKSIQGWFPLGSTGYSSWGSQGKNIEVVCHSLLQWTRFCQLSTMTCSSWVALHSMAHSFIDLDKAGVHEICLISFLWLWFSFCLPSEG